MTTLSHARVVALAEYGHGEDGFAIERPSRNSYAIPAWDEMGLGSLCGPFTTAAEAEAALANAREWY